MTLKYWMLVERCPKPNGVVGNSIPSHEIFLLLDGEKISHVATHLMCSKFFIIKIILHEPLINLWHGRNVQRTLQPTQCQID